VPSEAVDEPQSNKSKDKIDGPGDDDVEHDTADTVTGVAVNLLSVIEDHVDSTPLLKHSQKNTDSEDAHNRSGQQLTSPQGALGLGGQSSLDLGKRVISIPLIAYLDERGAGLLSLSVFHQPARAFRDQQRAEQKDKRGHRDGREHPAPAELAIPRYSDLFGVCSCRDLLRDQPIHNLCAENTDNNRKLVERDKPSAPQRQDLLPRCKWASPRRAILEQELESLRIEENRLLEAYRLSVISAAQLGQELEKLGVSKTALENERAGLNEGATTSAKSRLKRRFATTVRKQPRISRRLLLKSVSCSFAHSSEPSRSRELRLEFEERFPFKHCRVRQVPRVACPQPWFHQTAELRPQ
jgi:hypothetical protein